jgi:hypothetical protein
MLTAKDEKGESDESYKQTVVTERTPYGIGGAGAF